MIKIITLFIFIILFSNNSFGKKTSIYTKIYTTQYSSTSNEIVNDPNTRKKLSELIWEIDNITLIGIGLKIPTKKNLKLNGSIEFLPMRQKALMNDYDWLKDDTSNWSDWSNHPNTKIENIINLDLNTEYKSKSNLFKYKYLLNTGVSLRHHSFKAYGGSYVYSSNNGFRDKTGTFDNSLGISYEETFVSLYLKGTAFKIIDKYYFNASFLYSPATFIKNKDTHHDRGFINNNTFSISSMYEYGLIIKYFIKKNISIGIDYKYRTYLESKGRTNRTYYKTTNEGNAGDSYSYTGASIKSTSTSYTNFTIVFKF